MTIRIQLIFIIFLIISSLTISAFAKDKRPYISNKYRLTFDYPSSYGIKRFGEGYFDIFKNGKIFLRGSVEDEALKIFIHESKRTRDTFHSFARERCKIVSGADGPDGSSYCDEIKSRREYISSNGLRVLEFYLIMTREDYSRNTKNRFTVGPVYIVDISRTDQPLALMIFPGHGTLASEKVKRLAETIIESLRLTR
jgi:hypothetical protein